MSKGRIVVVFGQFGAMADPINLPAFNQRLIAAGFETILVQHTDTQKAYNFLKNQSGFRGVVGASLGAGVAPIMAGYLAPGAVNFVGGFQPSDYDPVMHAVNIPTTSGDVITRAVSVPSNVLYALCFRNPVVVATGGLGHAAYVLADGNTQTQLRTIERNDVHPGDFGESQSDMINAIVELSNGNAG